MIYLQTQIAAPTRESRTYAKSTQPRRNHPTPYGALDGWMILLYCGDVLTHNV